MTEHNSTTFMDGEMDSAAVSTMTNSGLDSGLDNDDYMHLASYISAELLAILHQYAKGITNLELTDSPEPLNSEGAIELLLARDLLQKTIAEGTISQGELLITISELDDRLYYNRSTLLNLLNLEEWRKVIAPPESSWWWFMTPPIKEEPWDRLDGIWNLISLLFLAGFASLMTQILPLVAADGVGIFESFGLVGPAALISTVSSNMQGGEGQEKFAKAMQKIGIPKRFCSEVTCLIAGVLFAGALVARQHLPTYYFNSSVKLGEKQYLSSKLIDAKNSFEQALKIPEQSNINVAKVHTNIGLIYESVGENDQAIESYQRALEMGSNQALNNIGRVYIAKGDLELANTYLKIGLERVEGNPQESENHLLRYQIHRNLGWSYLLQKRYREAEWELGHARIISRDYLPEDTLGRGMAVCLLAQVYEETERPKEALELWGRCRNAARPETIAEYRAIVKFKPSISEYISTKNIF
ncbi:MAG: tetratricopeptide repeat protein [Pseudanabaenaceae cyanobacterium]|jgi:tetratricopeptide (TPR) repeat protein